MVADIAIAKQGKEYFTNNLLFVHVISLVEPVILVGGLFAFQENHRHQWIFFSVNNKDIRNAASELFTKRLMYKNGKILFFN